MLFVALRSGPAMVGLRNFLASVRRHRSVFKLCLQCIIKFEKVDHTLINYFILYTFINYFILKTFRYYFNIISYVRGALRGAPRRCAMFRSGVFFKNMF